MSGGWYKKDEWPDNWSTNVFPQNASYTFTRKAPTLSHHVKWISYARVLTCYFVSAYLFLSSTFSAWFALPYVRVWRVLSLVYQLLHMITYLDIVDTKCLFCYHTIQHMKFRALTFFYSVAVRSWCYITYLSSMPVNCEFWTISDHKVHSKKM